METERGAFPLLYPYDDVHIQYDSSFHIENRNANSSMGGKRDTYDEKRLTWAEYSKHRLYSDNFLLNSGTLLQQWPFRTLKNIKYLRLRCLGKEQMSIVEEQKLRDGKHTRTDEIGPPRKTFLPGSHKNSTAYWRQNCLDIQEMVGERKWKYLAWPTRTGYLFYPKVIGLGHLTDLLSSQEYKNSMKMLSWRICKALLRRCLV